MTDAGGPPLPAGAAQPRAWRVETGLVVDGLAPCGERGLLVHAHAGAARAARGARAAGAWALVLEPDGRERWRAPCEVGYGRGLALAPRADGRAWVLGPGARGALALELDLARGAELRRVGLPTFDDAGVRDGIALGAGPEGAFAFDLEAGALLWERRRPGERLGPLAAAGGWVALARWREERREGDLLLLALASGEPAARCGDLGAAEVRLAALDERLFVLGLDPEGSGLVLRALSLLERSVGLELWSARLPRGPGPATLGVHGGALRVAAGARLLRLDPASGAALREREVPELARAPLWTVAGGTLVVARGGTLHALPLDAPDGSRA